MSNQSAVEILLVEDKPSDVELTIRAFKKNNLSNNVLVAKDGAEALDVIFGTGEHADRDVENLPRVILLDLKLPKISGLEVLEKVKSDERTRDIPVVVLTSSQEDKDIQECYRLGVNSYIVKPVEFDKFLETVRELGLYWLLLNQMPK